MSVALPFGKRETARWSAAVPAGPPHCAAQGRERPQSRERKFSFAANTARVRVSRAESRTGSVGDVAAAGPSGVLSAPRAAVSHSGGVRRHRRYVFAPVIPLPCRRRPVDSAGPAGWVGRSGVGRSHGVGSCFAGPWSPRYATRSCAV